MNVTDDKWTRGGVTLTRHFQSSTRRLREEALSRGDYDPARLFKWGQMMALAVLRMMKAAERHFGAKGQGVMAQVLVELGREIGMEILRDFEMAPGTKEIEAISALTTYMNEEIWASPEVPNILNDDMCVCDILWCPHQDHYRPFDCRVQRYIVQGLLDAFQERTGIAADAQFTQIIPKGAKTCRFEMRRLPPGEKRKWTDYTERLAHKALEQVGSGEPPR